MKRYYSLAGFAMSTGFAARNFRDAVRTNDRLKMVDAVVTTAAALTSLLIVLRELKEETDA